MIRSLRACFLIAAFFSLAIPVTAQSTIDDNFIMGNLRLELGDYNGAINYYTKTIEANPMYISAYKNRGLALYNSCNHEAAIADFTRVIQLDPLDMRAYVFRGLSKYSLGDKAGACADWDMAGAKQCFEACEIMKEYCQ